jgi:hypothetical protein
MDAELEAIARDAVDSAYLIYRELGPGLLETIYEVVHTLTQLSSRPPDQFRRRTLQEGRQTYRQLTI